MEMPVPVPPHRYTVSEYLRLERTAAQKHEYRDGEIIAMAGGTYRHSLIIANMVGELRDALKGKPCRVLESNLRVRIPRSTLFTYPDATVICGQPQFDPGDDDPETLTNPRLIVEVLSPSTEAYDRGEKFTRYRQIDALQEYVLVSQDMPRVELFLRQPAGTWLFSAISGLDSTIRLDSLDIEIALAEIYQDIEFPPQSDIPTITPLAT